MNLDTLKARTDEIGDCWIWNSTTSSNGYPIIKPTGCSCQLVRRVAFALNGGVLLPRQPVVTTCGEILCINPEHLEASTTKKIARKATKAGAFSGFKRAIAVARGLQHRKKLSDDAVKEIRTSTETGPVLAARYGVDRSLVNRIKTGAARKDYRNPFLQLVVA